MGWETHAAGMIGLVALSPLVAQGVPAGVGSIIWADEFDGVAVDPTKWQVNEPGVWGGAVNTSAAVSVSGGAMKIATYTVAGTHFNAVMGTQDTALFKYGYFEARIQFNSSPGMWSAFWLMSPTMGDIIGDPGASGAEIDIVEHRAVNQDEVNRQSHLFTALHWDGYGVDHQAVTQLHGPFAGLTPGSWHTYGLLWKPDGYTFYFDDQVIWTQTVGVSQTEQYIVLSSEIGNPWAGPVPVGGYGTALTSTTNMLIDYVHVSQLPEPGMAGIIAIAFPAFLRRRRN